MKKTKMIGAMSLTEAVLWLALAGIVAGAYLALAGPATTSAQAYKLTNVLNNADVAYRLAYTEVSYSLPVSIDDKMNCFDFPKGTNYTDADLAGGATLDGDKSVGTSDEGIKNYYQHFDRLFRDSITRDMGFSSSRSDTASAGIYLPGYPRAKLHLCARGDARFLVIENIDGPLANKVLSNVNNKSATLLDSALGDRRVSAWTGTYASFKNDGMSEAFLEAARKSDAVEKDPTKSSDGKAKPYGNEEQIAKLPAVTLVYLLNADALQGGW